MKENVKIPSVGESIVEGVLVTWYKKSGEYVKTGEDLYEFETEKASVTVPSPFDGVLEIIVQEGTKVKIDQVIAIIDTEAVKQKTGKEPDTGAAAPPLPVEKGVAPGPGAPEAKR